MVSLSTLRVSIQLQSPEAAVRSSVPARRVDGLGHARSAATDAGSTQSAQADGVDLTEELARRLEQDADYQILRKTFDLKPLVSTRSGASGTAETTSARLAFQDVQRVELDVGARVSVRTERFDAALRSSGEGATQSLSAASLSLVRETRDQSVELQQVRTADPLALDLGGRGFETTGVAAGVAFDLNGDGELERISTVSGDTWLLALDLNGNGRTDDGRELFGDQQGSSQGFEELRRYDDNADGVIDSDDSVYTSLRLVQFGPDGEESQQDLTQAKVVAIDLGYQNVRKAIDLYDYVAQIGTFRFADGEVGEAADLQLGYVPQD